MHYIIMSPLHWSAYVTLTQLETNHCQQSPLGYTTLLGWNGPQIYSKNHYILQRLKNRTHWLSSHLCRTFLSWDINCLMFVHLKVVDATICDVIFVLCRLTLFSQKLSHFGPVCICLNTGVKCWLYNPASHKILEKKQIIFQDHLRILISTKNKSC